MNRRGFLKVLGLAPVAVAVTAEATPTQATVPGAPVAGIAEIEKIMLEPPTSTCVMGVLDAKDLSVWSAQRVEDTLAAIRTGREVCVSHDTMDVIKHLPPPRVQAIRVPGDE